MKLKLKKTGNEYGSEIVREWYVNATARNLPLSGTLVQEHAEVVNKMGKSEFRASIG
jgi:hypothetical protein